MTGIEASTAVDEDEGTGEEEGCGWGTGCDEGGEERWQAAISVELSSAAQNL